MNIKNILKLYAENGLNVMLSGRHGIGKTALIKEVFNELYGDRWAYFSSPTMDAYIDFIGAPRAVENDDGVTVLKLIKPERFAYDEIEALFFDEFNRAPKKIRDAVMELIQFKSINGKKYNNLKIVWGAINPSDDDDMSYGYDVETIDPAQYDRFEIHIDIPYKLDNNFFIENYGDIAIPFTEWWLSLDKEIQFNISPRRLEAAIKVYLSNGDLSHVLPKKSNITELKKRIKECSIEKEWEKINILTKEEKIKFFLKLSNIPKFESFIINDFKNYINLLPIDFVLSKYKGQKDVKWLKSSVINVKHISKEIKLEFAEFDKDLDTSFIENLEKLGKFTYKRKNKINVDLGNLLD